MSTKQAFAVKVADHIYMELHYQLRKRGDLRPPMEVTAIALKEWMLRNFDRPAGRGYQWKDFFLPDGTHLRIRHNGLAYFAQIEGDQLVYEGKSTSPSAWCELICGSVRNAWRDVWIRRNYTELWTQASAWRAAEAANPKRPGIDRRRHGRRSTD
jgi:hypothetical protein